MSKQDEFIQSLDGELTAEQAAQLLEMGLEGDTGATPPETGGEPAAPAELTADTLDGVASDNESITAAAGEGEPDPDNAVIVAKDGKHHISYDKLVEARQSSQEWKAKAEAAQAELDTLKAQAEARAAAGQSPTATDTQVATAQAAIDAGIDPAIFGDFSEEALAKGIQELVDQRVQAALATVEAKLGPIEQRAATDASAAHYDAIYKAHPDADSIAESKELAGWIASQPSFVRSGYQAVLQGGTTQEVIELFDSFKQATGATQAAAAPDQGDVKAAAAAALANARTPVPTSLTDFPGGKVGAGTREEALAQLGGSDLLDAMSGMTPEQIETFLNRRL